MKIIQLTTLAAFVVLGGCASTASNTGNVAASADDHAAPLGTLFAKKGASGSDPSQKANMQSLENDRAMNNNGLTIRQ